MLTAHSPPQLNLQCQPMRDTPEKMCRGSAVTCGNTIYCISADSYTIYSYHTELDKWEKYTECPNRDTALTMIYGYLTAVGGWNRRDRKTNKLQSWKEGKWTEEVPPMIRPRWDHAVVTDGHRVVVAGGEDESSVEVFTESWSIVAELPLYLDDITATLCGDLVYVMDNNGRTYSSSLTSLLSTRPTDTPSTHSIWHPIDTLPVIHSTLSTIGSQVVAVGGEREGTRTEDILGLVSSQWTIIGYMNTARSYPITAVLPVHRLLVIGTDSFPSSPSSSSVELVFY